MPDVQLLIKLEAGSDEEDVYFEVAQAAKADVVQSFGEGGRPRSGPQPQIEPVTAVLIGGGALAVAKFVMSWIDRRKGGMVLDLRPGTPNELRRDRAVPWGHFVTIFADGTVQIETRDEAKDGTQQLLEQIVSGVFSTAAELTKAAEEVLPDGSVAGPAEA